MSWTTDGNDQWIYAADGWVWYFVLKLAGLLSFLGSITGKVTAKFRRVPY